MPKAKSSKTPAWEVGQVVSFEFEGETVEGTITSVDLKAKEVDVEGDAFPTVLTCEFGEITLVEPEEQQKETPKKKGKDKDEEPVTKKDGTKSLKGSFTSKPPADPSGARLPVGTFEALIGSGECSTNDKGTSAYLEFTLVNGDSDGMSGRKFYQLYDENDEPLDLGIGILKRDMIDIGFEDDVFDELDDSSIKKLVAGLNDILKRLKKLQPWVGIRTQDKKGYINIYIQQLMEDQDQKPEMPT